MSTKCNGSSEGNEKDLRMNVCCVATIDDVLKDQEGKIGSEIELKKRVKKELTCKSSRFSEITHQQFSEAFDQY